MGPDMDELLNRVSRVFPQCIKTVFPVLVNKYSVQHRNILLATLIQFVRDFAP